MQWRWPRAKVAGAALLGGLACSNQHDDPGGAGGGGTGGACAAEGSGAIEVQITGLPAGLDANLIVEGPLGSRAVTGDTTFGEAAGPYVLRPGRVAQPDPIVRTLFGYTLAETEFCLEDGGTHRVELAYAPIATSHRLWISNSNGSGDLLGFEARSLTASAEVAPAVAAVTGAGRDVTFDAEGNLWSLGATPADPHLMRLSPEALASSGEKQPGLRSDVAGISCLPALRAFAFSRSGSLWLSTCSGVVELDADALRASEAMTPGDRSSIIPGRSITGFKDNGALAFDSSENLWLSDAARLLRFDAARLGSSAADAPDAELTIRDGADARDVRASDLAFDGTGNLWVIEAGGNLVSKIAASDLEGAGRRRVVSQVSITLGVAAQLERAAFDESGGMWLALGQDRFGRLAPDQLRTSSTSYAPTLPATLITSPGMGYAQHMAFYPAPADLPLYHHFAP